MRCYDVAIVGAGFSGSILAAILAAQGREVLLLDRGSHPRFAIGESSTPLADLILDRLAERYRLPGLAAMARYGRWKKDLPHLMCGAKRGFSYFQHTPGQAYHDTPDHRRSLLVTASPSQSAADTHWMRSDVDAYLVQLANGSGVEYRPQTEIEAAELDATWHLVLRSHTPDASGTWQAQADFIIDASGGAAFAKTFLGVADATSQLRTHTRAVYGHLNGVPSWSESLRSEGWLDADDPFDADDAAQHHLLADGWLWMLRFDDGRTSVGRSWHGQAPSSVAAAECESSLASAFGVEAYPALQAALATARCVAPETGLMRTGRLQHRSAAIAGQSWALLPTAAATLDPLHSTGIAHGLSGVQRLAAILTADLSERATGLARYAIEVDREVRFADALVACSYAMLGDFERFAISTMLYFVAAIDCEERYAAGEVSPCLWSTDNAALMTVIRDSLSALRDPSLSTERLQRQLAQQLQPWNKARLLDPAAQHRYRYTAAKKSG